MASGEEEEEEDAGVSTETMGRRLFRSWLRLGCDRRKGLRWGFIEGFSTVTIGWMAEERRMRWSLMWELWL